MAERLKVLVVDVASSFYRVDRYDLGDFFGPVDLGLFLSGRTNSLNIGTGILAGSIIPGSNRLIFTGFSPCWGGFYISSMGGAGVEFRNLGIDLLSIVGKAPADSVLYLNRQHGEDVEVEVHPVDTDSVWSEGRGGVYSMMDRVFEDHGGRFLVDPRVLAVGPAARATDFGAIASVPISGSKLTHIDTWAGRGGFGSKLLQQHGIASIIFGGTHIEEDFRDRKVADGWFEAKYQQRLAAKDLEVTTKYRFDPKFSTGGTFGVNYASMGGGLLAFNYSSIFMKEQDRLDLHKDFVVDHYLRQFNEETIEPKKQKTCGEPCAAVCKKYNDIYKKDYEPYQVMGPLAGIFDQRAAEKLNHHADMLGFDAISAGGVLAWLMECLAEGLITPEETGASGLPHFSPDGFDIVSSSMHNADIGMSILDSIVEGKGILDLSEGARKFARRLARERGREVVDRFVYTGFARKGWMVPNQYWTAGVFSPMPIMGKYYMFYGQEFLRPRELGRADAQRFRKELVMDDLGICRFHRGWAEEMLPEIIESLFGRKERLLEQVRLTACRINSRNASVFWESERVIDIVSGFLIRRKEVAGETDPELDRWIDEFRKDKKEAALAFWYEIHKGIQESLLE